DRAKFHNNATLSAIELDGGAGDANIYGDIPSSTMGDATLALQTIGGTTLCTTNFTVLWVDISMRCGQDDNFSSDNGCAIKPSPAKLGAQRVFVGGVEVSMGNNVEFIGSIHPSDFVSSVSMNRDNTNAMLVAKMPNGGWNMLSYEPLRPRGTEPACNDSTEPDYQDRNPAPNGRVFDFDTPGIGVSAYATLPEGTILYEIQNFLQYALWNQKRCSNDFPWFSRTSLVKNPSTSFFVFDFAARNNHPEDNSCGFGATPLVVY
ncbi:MAG: hypothetical protein IJT64_02820, partial [Kiritimatiellae bacterium]|nr:hypothetical protein [Kiritimatiellia bacterium]